MTIKYTDRIIEIQLTVLGQQMKPMAKKTHLVWAILERAAMMEAPELHRWLQEGLKEMSQGEINRPREKYILGNQLMRDLVDPDDVKGPTGPSKIESFYSVFGHLQPYDNEAIYAAFKQDTWKYWHKMKPQDKKEYLEKIREQANRQVEINRKHAMFVNPKWQKDEHVAYDPEAALPQDSDL